jgi:hypothetical protein
MQTSLFELTNLKKQRENFLLLCNHIPLASASEFIVNRCAKPTVLNISLLAANGAAACPLG